MSAASAGAPVVVVGATGDLGGRVLARLASQAAPVRALLRGADPGSLPPGVEIVHGDLLDPASLDTALAGARALVSTATGYSDWKRPNRRVDGEGNRNLVDAAARAGVQRFVFTSVLAADKAQTVEPFWQKKLTEDYLEESGLPYLALRAGTIIGGRHDFWARDVSHGRLSSLIGAHAPTSIVHIDQLAGYLTAAVDPAVPAPGPIDIGADPPASYQQLAEQLSVLLGRRVKLRALPWPLVRATMFSAGVFSPRIRHFRALLAFLASGSYTADPSQQQRLFGQIPSLEDTLRLYLDGLATPGSAASRRS